MSERFNGDHVWTEEEERKLAKLWASGLSAAKIGTTMHLTKNQVIGKARRIGLPPRPKCVYGDGPGMRQRAVQSRRRSFTKGV
jgi:hypothetical protein